MGNGARQEQCSSCGVHLLVPSSARTIRCAVCGNITNLRQQHQDPATQAAGWVKGLLANVTSAINSYSSSSSLPYYGYQAHGYPPAYGYADVVPRPPSYPPAHGRKRALVCGVSYRGRRYELKGTVNDVQCMRFMLRERFRFPDDCILVLTEDEVDPYHWPTKQNLRAAMQWLVRGCRAGDSLIFHFSGHGVQLVDTNADEADGFDEALCPVDYEGAGTILDDEINDTLVRLLPSGAKLHAVVDACHSGTVLDLPYLCRMNRAGYCQWEDHRPPSGVYKGTSGGLAISFSGCDDNQTSADTNALSRNTITGAMTYSFIQALESQRGTTYGSLLNAMRMAIREADTGIRTSGPIASLIRKVFHCGLNQEPQLCSSETFDVYRKPFIL